MAIPQGNFVALQALKPKEYKIGDLYLQMTDYLIISSVYIVKTD